MKKLPETEYDVMKVIWNNTPPVTTTVIMDQLGNERIHDEVIILIGSGLKCKADDLRFVLGKISGADVWYIVNFF